MATKEQKVDAKSKDTGTKKSGSALFETKVNRHVLHQVVRWQRAKKRAGTHATKTRATASGGGTKPWRQKGTGRARAGSNTSPLWVGGGIAHGPKPRDYEFRLNRKERRAALLGAVSARQAEGCLHVVKDLGLDKISTKKAAKAISSLGVTGKALVVVAAAEETAWKSLRNIRNLRVLKTDGLNVYDVLNARHLVFTDEALQAVQSKLGANS